MKRNNTDRLNQQIQRIEERIQKEEQRRKIIKGQIKVQDRKKRTHELIQVGALFEVAELLEYDRGALLGLLLQGKQMLEDTTTRKNLERIGHAELQRRAKNKSTGRRVRM